MSAASEPRGDDLDGFVANSPADGARPPRRLLGAVSERQGRWRLIGLLLLLLTIASGLLGLQRLPAVAGRKVLGWAELAPWIVCAGSLLAALVVAIGDIHFLRKHFRRERERLLRAMAGERDE